MENPTCRQYNLYMHEEDTFPCRRYIVKYDDKGIAEEAFSIKRNNTEDFPEFFDDRIFKLDKATALTGKDHREIVQTLQRIVKGTGEEVWLDSHHISNKEYNGYIDAYSEESFLKRAEKMRKKAKTTAFPVAGQQDGNLLPAQETERNADEVPAKQLAANAKKRRPQKVLAQFESAVLTRRKSLPFSGRLFEQTRLCRQDVFRHNILFENIIILR
mgnify:CR=1 FL=1